MKNKEWTFSLIELFFTINNNIKFFSNAHQYQSDSGDTLNTTYEHMLFDDKKEFNSDFFIKNFIKERLTQLSPMFSYFVYNVDKNIRKYTRGKSGKYVFVWKYIAPYKRKYLMFRWFLKEIKFDENRQLQERLKNMFFNLTFNITQTLAWRAKNYTYTFIFKNFRKTLMTSLKTIAK